MKINAYGAVAGALIVSLALTAGQQFAEAQSANKYWSECTKQSMANVDLLTSAQDNNREMLKVVTAQKARIEHLEAQLAARSGVTHNVRGGYIAACGALPGMLGDDC